MALLLLSVCRADGIGVGCPATQMNGAKGCGSGAASLARPGCGFGKAGAFPKRGREVDQPAALPSVPISYPQPRGQRQLTKGRRFYVQYKRQLTIDSEVLCGHPAEDAQAGLICEHSLHTKRAP